MKKITLAAFILIALLQLAVPAHLVWDREYIITEGNPYKFRTAPVDPYDYFRGKYITLYYLANTFETVNDGSWQINEPVYVHLGKDAKGFAKIVNISKQEPSPDKKVDYILARIQYVYDDRLTIDFPFNRYYMEETKAPEAETKYRESARDTSQVVYALVNVKDGDAVLKDVIVNDKPIKDLVGKKE